MLMCHKAIIQSTVVDVSVSIARRLQDPLSELVKIDPKNLGVGMYQVSLTLDRQVFVTLCILGKGYIHPYAVNVALCY